MKYVEQTTETNLPSFSQFLEKLRKKQNMYLHTYLNPYVYTPRSLYESTFVHAFVIIFFYKSQHGKWLKKSYILAPTC